MRLTIYLIRHGEKDNEGKYLSKRGIKQIKLLSNKLSKVKFDKFYSSICFRFCLLPYTLNGSSILLLASKK